MENMTNVHFYRAAERGKLKEVIEQLEAGADVNYSSDYDTALTVAAYNGHLKIVELLIEKGADVYQKNYYENTALLCAAGAPDFRKVYVKIVDLLLSKMESKQKYLDKALYYAAESHNGALIKYLLEKGADVNAKYKGSTVLHRMADLGATKDLKMLLKRNPDMNPKDSQGWTPLRLIVEYNRSKANQKLLIKNGAHE